MSELRFLFSGNEIIVVDEITIVVLEYFLVILIKRYFYSLVYKLYVLNRFSVLLIQCLDLSM